MTTDSANPFDALRDAILRGVAHALSNRVAALGGIAGLVDPGQVWTDKMSKALHDEARRLGDVLRLLRLVPSDVRVEAGAVELQPLIPDVVALHAYNSMLLQVECAIEYNREAMPVFGNRIQIVRALLLVIDTAKQHARTSGGRVVIRYSGDAERVRVEVATEPSATPAAASASATPNGGAVAPTPSAAGDGERVGQELRLAIARVTGDLAVEVQVENGTLRVVLTLPTLAAGRHAERGKRSAER